MQFYTLAKDRPQFSVFGGRIIPCWPDTPPTEIIEGVALGEAFAIHELDIPDGEVPCEKVWGPNMAVRTAVFHAGFRYNEHIGPTQGRYIPGSESSFSMMLRKNGFRFYFSNAVIVQHQIRPEQLTMKWLKRRAYIFGTGRVVWDQMEQKNIEVKKLGIFPRWYASYLLGSYINYVVSFVSGDKTKRTRSVWNAMIAHGMIIQTVRIHRDAELIEPLLAQQAGEKLVDVTQVNMDNYAINSKGL